MCKSSHYILKHQEIHLFDCINFVYIYKKRMHLSIHPSLKNELFRKAYVLHRQ